MPEDDADGQPTDSIAELFSQHSATADEEAEEDVGDESADEETAEDEAGLFDDADEADDIDVAEEVVERDAVAAENSANAANSVDDANGVDGSEFDSVDGADHANRGDITEDEVLAGDGAVVDGDTPNASDVDGGGEAPVEADRGSEADGVGGTGHFEEDVSQGMGGIDESKLEANDRKPTLTAGATRGMTDPNAARLSTGIDALDEQLGGGIPPGRIVSFVATADTQSELLVNYLTSQHDCLYLSTLRPKWEVEEEVTDFVQKQKAASNSVRIEQLTAGSRLEAARQYVEELERRSIVVIDSANELEALEKDRYVRFIDEVKRALWQTGSVALFCCIGEEQPPVGRAVTLRRADLILQLRRDVGPVEVSHQLLISKFRGGRALAEPLKVYLTDEVSVESRPLDA